MMETGRMVHLIFFLLHCFIQAAFTCQQGTGEDFMERLKTVCSSPKHELTMFYNEDALSCGDRYSFDVGYLPNISYSQVNDEGTYTLLSVIQDASDWGIVFRLPHLERVAINIKGTQIQSGYTGPWIQLDQTASYFEYKARDLKFTFVLLEQPTDDKQKISDFFRFIVDFGLCSPIAMAEIYFDPEEFGSHLHDPY